jgi:hexosaminidase
MMMNIFRCIRRYDSWFTGILVLFAVAAIPLIAAATDTMAEPVRCNVMPQPSDIRFSPGRLPVTETFRVAIAGYNDARLQAAVARALGQWSARTGLRLIQPPTNDAASAALTIRCQNPAAPVPAVEEDESYSVNITAERAELEASSVVGVMRGLETLLQLLDQEGPGFFLPCVSITDKPRLPWRGLMIDVVRHWQPIEVIKRNLDSMALVKLNVLHLHLTDNQGFRIESKRFPEFTHLASDGCFFTQEDIREIIAYAAARGIRVVPEFDLPGHAQAWVVAYPELASAPGPYALVRIWGYSDAVLDPTNEDLYGLLDGFLGEMANLFPDPYLHIGGDENNGRQWNANPKIQAFIRERGLKDNAGLQTYFNQRLAVILTKHGKHMVGWDEIFHPGLPPDAVIHSWRGIKSLADAARQGHSAILSNGYYIDLMLPAATHYRNDPLPANTDLSNEEQARILGGEATMWSEWVTPETIDSRIWPRSAAIAERLWSPRTVNDVAEMYRRLAIVSVRLEERGSLHAMNYEPMLRRLIGGSVAPAVFAAFRTFVDAVEPVKGGLRRRIQVGVTQQTPLTGVVDCARPESESARLFSADVNRGLFDSAMVSDAIFQLEQRLQSWRAAGLVVANEIAPQNARLEGAATVARSLAEVSDVGLEAIALLRAGRAPREDWTSEKLAALNHAAQPGAAAIELPMLPALRLLVWAATEQDKRQALSPEGWSRLLHEHANARTSIGRTDR